MLSQESGSSGKELYIAILFTYVGWVLEISNFIFTSKYARYSDKYKRRETWDEAVSRVEGMHLEKYSFLPDEDKEEIKKAFSLVRE